MSSSLILCSNNEPSLDWIDWDMQWKVCFIQQPATTSSVAGPRRNSKAKLAPKQCHSHCLEVCCQSDPLWILVKHYTWEVCSANRWDASKTATPAAGAAERTHFFSTTPNRTLYNQRFRSWTNWATKFCFVRHIHLTSWQPTTTSLIILTTFCRESFHDQQKAENAFQEFVESQSTDFYTTGIYQLIPGNLFFWQKCVDFNGSYFD